MPVLAAAGEADMEDFKRGAEQIVELVPDGELAMVQGAGHLAPLEASETFGRLLLGFLRGA
jgi:pimeloyl-ACP methyl ester carboxylesterase